MQHAVITGQHCMVMLPILLILLLLYLLLLLLFKSLPICLSIWFHYIECLKLITRRLNKFCKTINNIYYIIVDIYCNHYILNISECDYFSEALHTLVLAGRTLSMCVCLEENLQTPLYFIRMIAVTLNVLPANWSNWKKKKKTFEEVLQLMLF